MPIPHSVKPKLTHDYLKIYENMMVKWRSFLGERTPLFDAEGVEIPKAHMADALKRLVPHYISKKLYFDDSSIYSYSFTLSPRSSPILKDLPLKDQYNLLRNGLKNLLSQYDINYYITFELYEDNVDMHAHGFLTFSRIADIASIKKDLRSYFCMPKLKQGEKNRLTHIKPIGCDTDQQKRWIGYCYKDLEFMIRNNFRPIYKFTNVKITETVIKPKEYLRVAPTEEDIEEMQQIKNKAAYEKELAEYKLYEKLKAKFENKNSLKINI